MEQNQTCLHGAMFVCIGMGGGVARTYLRARGNLRITASSMSNGLFVAPRTNTRPCSLANHPILSMSAFLQTMLENLRPIPLMEVMANMIVFFPSMLVFSRFGITSRFSFPTSLDVTVFSKRCSRTASSEGSEKGGTGGEGVGGGAPTLLRGLDDGHERRHQRQILGLLLLGRRQGRDSNGLGGGGSRGRGCDSASIGGEASGREALGTGMGVNLVDLGGAAEESGRGRIRACLFVFVILPFEKADCFILVVSFCNIYLCHICSCFLAGFFSRKAEKLKAGTNDKFFNWLLKR
jgi:hypothetical protein